MVPCVALVGRQNVGKSTLFNRLTRTKNALVADLPGLTRDRKYGCAKVEGREFVCIDTGGIDDGTQEGVEINIAEQSLLAIKEADIVLFMVDAREGLMPADEAIAKRLRICEKPTFLVVNKTDGINPDQAVIDFWSLGLGKSHPIAALHGYGVTSLLKKILPPWKESIRPSPVGEWEYDAVASQAQCEFSKNNKKPNKLEDDFHPQNLPIKLAIVGRPNVGKSTLTNRILGKDRMVVYNMPGTTRDSIYIPMKRKKREYVLIDTAGVRKGRKITSVMEKNFVFKTLQAIDDANVVLLIIDAREGISCHTLSLLDFILTRGRSLVIVVNKWDGLSQQVKQQVKKNLNYRLPFVDFARVHFISALHGNGIGNLFKSINEAYDSSTRRISTAMLTRIMNTAVEDHPPPFVRGRRIKLKYAHVGGYNPPTVIIHGNQVIDLPDSYKRYLMNYFRKALEVIGTPIHLQFKEGNNPFAKKSNTLSVNQTRKFNRLIKHVKKKKYK